MAIQITVGRQIIAAVVFAMLLGVPVRAQAKKNTYTSPLGNFSVPVPGGLGQRTQKENDKDGGLVAFHDDLGNYRSIFYLRLSPRSLELREDPEAHRTNLEQFFDEYAMTWLFKPASPTASVLHREHTEFGGESAFFAVVDLPRGSTIFDAKAKKRLGTKRGMLVFTRGAFLYMAGSGENPSVFELGDADKPLEDLLQSERTKLWSFASTIRFD